MSNYLNQTFYQDADFMQKFDLHEIQKYMLTKERLSDIAAKSCERDNDSIAQVEKETSPVSFASVSVKEKKEDLFLPRQADTLFWCLYIIEHGYNDYVQVGRNYGVRELEEKKAIHDFVKLNVSRIKNTNYRITNVAIQEIQSELITVQKEMSMLCLIAMIVKYNINIIIVNASKTCMLEFWSNKETATIDSVDDDTKTYVLYKDTRGKYNLQFENIPSYKLHEMRNEMIVLDSYNRALKAISNYKVDDLESMARKLHIFDENRRYKKTELYESVLTAIDVF